MYKQKYTSTGISILGIIFISLIILKLTGNINWSWWWITSPLWIPPAICASLFIASAIAYVIAIIFMDLQRRKKRK